jgi:glycosyltransferase involved in cell wall biosynthesis
VSTVAFVLLSYRPDFPAGIERSVAALAEGVRRLGHSPLIVAGGPAAPGDTAEPCLVRLKSVSLPWPATARDVESALADPGPVVDEVRAVLAAHDAAAACWAEPLWGLGWLSPAPAGTRTALMVHKIRPAGEERWRAALAAADVICPASDWLAAEAAHAGYGGNRWTTVPNALLADPAPVPEPAREQLRAAGPVRIAARADPEKGIPEFLAAIPDGWTRPVQVVLADAGFELRPGVQQDVAARCKDQASRRLDVITLLPALGWREVPPFLARAAATVICSIEPETFCFTAAEALAGGTPVVCYDFGNVPLLTGPADLAVPPGSGPEALWDALARLLSSPAAYHQAARAAPARVAPLVSQQSAATLLRALRV